MARLSNILQAKDYEVALANYKDWVDTRGETSVRRTGGAVGAQRTNRRICYVNAFDLDDLVQFRTWRSLNSANFLGTFTGHVSNTKFAGQTDFLVFGKGMKPARIHHFEGGNNRVRVQSKITKLYYIKYIGDRYMSPFGKKVETDREATIANSIMEQARALSPGKDYVRTWVTPEDIVGRYVAS